MSWNTHIPKFRRFVIQNFPFIEEDFDALTDYALICKVIEYLNTVITSQNELVAEVERFEGDVNDEINTFETNITADFDRLEGLFNDLQSFVDNYFDNLDVQEEINNKLEEMADDGTLQEIITTYIQSNVAWTFDTVADMKVATNFVDGSFAQTLGYYAKNDGGASMYKIRTKTGEDVPDEMLLVAIGEDLVAELIYDTTINSKQCGLRGDGTTDESTKLSTFLNLDIQNKVINKGKYVFSTPLFIKGTWGNRNNRSVITYTFKDSTFKYTGTADTVAITFFNIQYGEIEGLNLSSDSNTCTINVIGVWDTTFKNCIINSLTLTSDGTSVSAYNPATTALQYVTFKDSLIKGTVTFTKPVGGGWINCIYFENCMLNGNSNAYANAIVYNGVTSFQNIQFDKCDISYYSTAIVKANDAITDKFASLTFNHCYFDRATIIDGSPDNSPKIVLLNTTNPNNAQSMTARFDKRMMSSNLNNTGYASGNNIGCEGINYLYNGDLSSSTEESGNYSALGTSGRGWTKTWTTSSRNRFNRARKLVYDGETNNPAIIFYGMNAPRDGFYPSFIRGRITSGTCTKIQSDCYGSYSEYYYSEIGNNEFLIVSAKDANYRTADQYLRMTLYVVAPSQDFEIEIYECGAFMGDTYMPNMPLHLLADRNT